MLKRKTEVHVKKLGAFFGFVLLAAIATNARAQTTDENAQFLAEIEVSARFDRAWDDASKRLPALVGQFGAREETDNPDLKVVREKLAAVSERFMGRFAEAFRKPEIRAEIVRSVKASHLKVFSPDYIDALATFYRSPAGRSVAAKLRDLSSESSSAMTDIVMRITTPIMEEQRAASKAITDEFMDKMRARAAEAKKDREKARAQQ